MLLVTQSTTGKEWLQLVIVGILPPLQKVATLPVSLEDSHEKCQIINLRLFLQKSLVRGVGKSNTHLERLNGDRIEITTDFILSKLSHG